jgi:hypothetical protein
MEGDGRFQDIRGSIGSLIWLWSRIERCAEGIETEPASHEKTPWSRSVSGRLESWQKKMQSKAAESPFRAALARQLRSDLRKASRVRNGVCHGLSGIEGAHGDSPGRLIWRSGSKQESLTWAEIQVHLAWLSKIPAALEILDRGDLRAWGRLVDTPENRVWWAEEFGILLTA